MNKADEIKNGNESYQRKDSKQAARLRYLRDKDREMVEGIFRFHEVPGGTMSFVYKAYKGDPVERYDLTDGGRYKLPLGVARHLNKNCWYPVHRHEVDPSGGSTIRVGQKVRRCSFQSLEFVDIDDITPEGDLVTVETVVNRPIE